MHRIIRTKAYEAKHGPHFVTKLNALQSDVDGIKCKLPNTVSVPYPQLSVYNPEVFKAAAFGAFAGDTYANYGVGYNNCGC